MPIQTDVFLSREQIHPHFFGGVVQIPVPNTEAFRRMDHAVAAGSGFGVDQSRLRDSGVQDMSTIAEAVRRGVVMAANDAARTPV